MSRADARGSEASFRQRHRQSAIAQIVRGFRQPCAHDLAHRRLHALFVLHVERRRQAPELDSRITLAYCVPPKCIVVARAEAAQQHHASGPASGK